MSERLIAQLETLKEQGQMNPDQTWVRHNRAALLVTIKSSAAPESAPKPEPVRGVLFKRISDSFVLALQFLVPRRLAVAARFALTVVLVAGVAVSGWIASVSASYDSLPGEPLYSVKVAAEKTELLVATVIGSEESQAATNLKHAVTKVEEYQKATSPEQAAVSIQSLKQKIQSTNKTLDTVETKSPQTAVAVAQVVEEKTEQILSALAQTKDAVTPASVTSTSTQTTSVSATSAGLSQSIVEVEGLLEETSVKAVEVLLETQVTGTSADAALANVGAKLEKRVERIISNLATLDVKLGETTQLVTSTASGQIPLPTLVSTTMSTSSDIALSLTVGTSTPATQTVLQKVEQVGQQVLEARKNGEAVAVEVKTLIGQNNLVAAVKKVQELKEVKQEATAAVSQVQAVVTEVVKQNAGAITPMPPATAPTGVNGASTTLATSTVGTSGTKASDPQMGIPNSTAGSDAASTQSTSR